MWHENGSAGGPTPLKGQVAVITGASRGIGRAIALTFARAGATLVLAARRREELDRTANEASELGSDVATQLCDVGEAADVATLFRVVDRLHERVDVLVNNAGAFRFAPLDALTPEDWDRVLATNLRGPFLCIREAFKLMKPRRRGRIINIGSISAERVRPHGAAYAASKHGLWGLTQVAALEGREFGITCGCLNPGNVAVERRVESEADEDQEPMLAPETIADVVLQMAALPPEAALLSATLLPRDQLFLGRG